MNIRLFAWCWFSFFYYTDTIKRVAFTLCDLRSIQYYTLSWLGRDIIKFTKSRKTIIQRVQSLFDAFFIFFVLLFVGLVTGWKKNKRKGKSHKKTVCMLIIRNKSPRAISGPSFARCRHSLPASTVCLMCAILQSVSRTQAPLNTHSLTHNFLHIAYLCSAWR